MLHGYEAKKPTAKMIEAQKLLSQEKAAERVIKAGGPIAAAMAANKAQLDLCKDAMTHMVKVMGEHAANLQNPKYRAGLAYRSLQRDLKSHEAMRRTLLVVAGEVVSA